MKTKFCFLLCLLLAFGIALCACAGPKQELPAFPGDLSSSSGSAGSAGDAATAAPDWELPSTPVPGSSTPAFDTVIHLSDGGCTVEGNGVRLDGNTVTVVAPGSYLLRGSLQNGQILVDVREKETVTLFLDGIAVTNPAGSALTVQSAPKKLVLSLPEGSVNLLSGGDPAENGETKAALFSKADLEITGEGTLSVTAAHCNGIYSKDDLTVSGGHLLISADGDGLRGKDSLTVSGGQLQIASGEDGMQSGDGDDPTLGAVRMAGGTVEIRATGDGIQAGATLSVEGGELTLVCGGGSKEPSSGGDFGGGFGGGGRPGGKPGGGRPGGFPGGKPGGDFGELPADLPSDFTGDFPGNFPGNFPGDENSVDPISAKGLKAESSIAISGGNIQVDSSDDAVHCNGDLLISGGKLRLSSTDDGIHADKHLTVSDGEITVTRSYEGIEGQYITVSGGTVSIVSSDDGFNATDGSASEQEGGFGGFGRPGGGMGGFGGSTDCSLTVSGGKITVNAGGDGLDSNGSIFQTGGEIFVYGPTNSGNGAIDYGDGRDCGYSISGGSLVALGAPGMAQSPTAGGQAVLAGTIGTQSANAEIQILSSAGTVVLTVTTPKSCGHLVYSAPVLQAGERYTVQVNGKTVTTLQAN